MRSFQNVLFSSDLGCISSLLLLSGYLAALPRDAAATEEEIEIQEEHHAEVDREAAYLQREDLKDHLCIWVDQIDLDDDECKAYIEQIEADLKEAIGRQGYILAAMKDVQHKDLAIGKQGACYEECEDDDYREIDEVGGDDVVHILLFL